MAVTALSGQRWQGSSATGVNSGWIQNVATGSMPQVVNDVGIDLDTAGVSGTNKVRHLIGTTLSDTEWVMRFKLNHKDSGGAESPILALCKTNTTGDDFWSNAIMVYANSSGSDPAELSATYYSSSANGQSSSITLVDGTTYYVELIRTASDNVTISVFTGSDYLTGQVGSTQAVNSSNITGIDDLISIQSALGTKNGARDIDVVIQEIKIYNGITSVSSETPVYETNFSASSNLPENTIFNETDTYRQYWLQDNTGISKSGCLGFWQFQEQSGAVINHATIANGFPDGLGSAADGVIDAGLKRDAVGKFRPYAYEWLDGGVLSVDVPDQTALSSGLTGDITITMWIYPTEDYTSNGRVFMAKRDATTTTTYQLFWHSSNLLSYYNGTTYNGTMNASGPMTLDAWNFIAITISSNTLTIYLNGYNLGTHTVGTRNTNSAPLTFGQTSLDNLEEYAGRIQDSTIWNRALSEAEITAMYNSNRGVIDMVSGVGWYY